MSIAEQFLTYSKKKQCIVSHGENYQAEDKQHCNRTTRGNKGKLRKPTFGPTELVLLIFIGQT